MVLTDLQHKGRKVEGVIVHHDAPGVANDGVSGTDEHARHEPPLLPPDAEIYMDQGGDGVQRNEAEVGGERGTVPVHGGLHWADFKCAVGSGAEDHHVRRQAGHTERRARR